MKLSSEHEKIIQAKICPYCKSETKLLSEFQVYGKQYNKNRMIIACKNYPKCDSYVGTHDNGIPLGRLAGPKLRLAKKEAHHYFDKLWKEGFYKRGKLYKMLSKYLNIPEEYTHIGMFSIKTCYKVKDWAKNLYQQKLNKK